MTTIEYTRRFPVEQYGYEEFHAACQDAEELANVRLLVDTLIAERPESIPFEPPASDDGYYDEPPAKPVRAVQQGKPQNRQAANRRNQRGVACGVCGGETWDNRPKKRSGDMSDRAPDFKCKDKDGCGGAMWLTNDGEHGEWKQ